MSAFVYEKPGYCDICEKSVVFRSKHDWFRDHLLCSSCGSVPRERALMQVLNAHVPAWRDARIHESSPIGRGVSARLSRQCRDYSYSHYFSDIPSGSMHPTRAERCENLEALSFAESQFDVIITQDVLEHVFEPDTVFREIERVLKPGGKHIFTVPLVRKCEPSVRRARRDTDGSVEHLKEAQFHGNPVDSNGSLVIMDWGFDILHRIGEVTDMASWLIAIDDIGRGVRAEFIDVIVSIKR